MQVRAATTYNHPHPDVVAYVAGIAALHYDLDRRRFMRDFPDEEPPQAVAPLGDSWLADLVELHLHDAETLRRLSQKNTPAEADDWSRYGADPGWGADSTIAR